MGLFSPSAILASFPPLSLCEPTTLNSANKTAAGRGKGGGRYKRKEAKRNRNEEKKQSL